MLRDRLAPVAVAVLAAATAGLAQPPRARAEITQFGRDQCYCAGVGVDAAGDVYLTDVNTDRILKFTASGAYLTTISSAGSLDLDHPTDVTALPGGNLAVVDGNRGVYVMTPAGGYVSKLTTLTGSRLAADAAGDVYVTHSAGVTKLTSDGNTSTPWTDAAYEWDWPTGIAYSPANGHLYVTDGGAHRVTELSTTGTVVRRFGTFGNGAGQLNAPDDVAVDAAGAVYIAQSASGGTGAQMLIKKFTATGQEVGVVHGSFWQPNSLAVDGDRLYAAAYNMGAVRIDLTDPIVALTPATATVTASQEQAFDASGSSLPFGSITRYEWDLDGDGAYETDTGTTGTAARRFVTPGTATVRVRVTGSAGVMDSAAATIAVRPSAAVIRASANPALTGVPVTFDAGASALAASAITAVAWDLDGNGSFETSTGAATSVSRAYDAPGTYRAGVRVTRSGGVVDTAATEVQLRSQPPAGPVGVSINGGERYTNDPAVTLRLVWPALASDALVSNDGGFGTARRFAVAPQMAWTLDSSGPERLPKTVYLRFDASTQTFQDDIILDQTAPVVQTAQVAPVAAPSRATAAAKRRFRIRLKATDKTSGVGRAQVAVRKARPGALLRYRTSLTVSGARPKYVRVQDRAGNFSRWRTLATQKKAARRR